MAEQLVIERARKVKALVLDGDGVIFTGHVLEGMDGPLAKTRHHCDGQGISLIRAAGMPVACMTGESGKHAVFLEKLVEKWNSLPSVKEGRWHPVPVFTGAERSRKVDIIKSWLAEFGFSLEECAAMGDDLTDYDLIRAVGLAAAPAQAEDIIKRYAHYIAPRRGGHGAVRDFANLILEAKGIDVTALALR